MSEPELSPLDKVKRATHKLEAHEDESLWAVPVKKVVKAKPKSDKPA